MRLAARKFLGFDLIEEQIVNADAVDLCKLAEQHATGMLTGNYDSVEIEFLDDPPDSKTRFFRVGTNPATMVNPGEFDPDSDPDAHKKILERWGHEPKARARCYHRGRFK